jgi:diguanylate cyclase (GGDEF)-like protein
MGALWMWWPGTMTQVLSQDYMPHGYCFFWNKQLVALHVVSDITIALAYLSIATMLAILFVRERKRVPVAGIFIAFSTFIVACGTTHAMDVLVLWRPLYWLQGDLKLVTAVVSLLTAVALLPLLPRARGLIGAALSSRMNEKRFLAASDSSHDAFFILESVRDAAGEITDFRFGFVNVNGARLLSSTPQALAGQLLCENYPVSRSDVFFEQYKRVVETGQSLEAEFEIHAEKINATWLKHLVVKLDDGVAITTTDIAERKEKELRLTYVAQHDALTGLASRTLFEERLVSALEQAGRQGCAVGLLMVDCDNFKRVNDLMGHQVGDALLVEVAARLEGLVSPADTVARMGGDEFMVVLSGLGRQPEVSAEQEGLAIAQRMLAAMQEPMLVNGHAVSAAVSIGLCVHGSTQAAGTPVDANCAAALFKNTDAAMYRAKAEGRNRVQLFTLEMASSLARRRLLESALENALALEEFRLVYQPRVDLRTGTVTGVEALLRWHSGELGLVMPAEFIPMAEENGLIVPIGRWVLEQACLEMHELGLVMGRTVPVAVNVSPRQFQQEALSAEIAVALKRCGMEPSALEVEITEGLLLHESSTSLANLDEVRAMGVSIAIDDFGTGYSSMSYLTRFHVERIKIDQSFVRTMNHHAESDAVCKAIVGLAKALNICIVAEGVENGRQRDLLRALGCDEAQGNLYAEPVPLCDLPEVLRAIENSSAGSAGSAADALITVPSR